MPPKNSDKCPLFPRAQGEVLKLLFCLTNCQKTKDIQFGMIHNREQQQILRFQKLLYKYLKGKAVNNDYFQDQSICRLFT